MAFKKRQGGSARVNKVWSKGLRSQMRKDQAERALAAERDATIDPNSTVTAAEALPPDPKRSKLTRMERLDSGLLVVDQQQVRTKILVDFVLRYDEPDESDWPKCAAQLASETGMNTTSIKAVFKKCRDGDLEDAAKRKKGGGRESKLEADNPGLIAAAIALKSGVTPAMATVICNQRNTASNIVVTRNTLMLAIQRHTDMLVQPHGTIEEG